MKFKRVARRLTAVIMLVCICTGLVGGIVYGATATNWGFNSGVDFKKITLGNIRAWYVGDFEILNHFKDADYKSEKHGKSYGGIKVGYRSFNPNAAGSDNNVYELFSHCQSKASKKLKDFIKEDGSGFLQKKAYNSNLNTASESNVKEWLTPTNCSIYHPLNVLRMMQMYLLSRKDNNQLIGGWPVQLSSCSNSPTRGSYVIEVARTGKDVYKIFTGLDYIRPQGNAKDPKEGQNYDKNSIYGKLLNGSLTFDKASDELVKKLKSNNIRVYSNADLMTNGNLTYEEYLSRCLRGKLAYESKVDKNSGQAVEGTQKIQLKDPSVLGKSVEELIDSDPTNPDEFVVVDYSKFNNFYDNLRTTKDEKRSRQFYYMAVFTYMEEYGIHFNTFNKAKADSTGKTKTIFKLYGDNNSKGHDLTYPVTGTGSNGKVVTLNLKSNNCPIAEAIGQELKSSWKSVTGNKYDKRGMYDVLQDILQAAKKAETDDDKFDSYFIMDQTCALGQNIESISQFSNLSDEVRSQVRDTAAKTAKGLNGLNKIDDTYVVKFFLDLCAQSGTSGNNAVDIEYMKIMNILNRKNVKQGKQTLNDCFAMMYSLENIGKCGKEYTMTFKARDSSQISSILKYTSTHMKRVWRYFREDKGNSNNEPIDSYRNPELKDNSNALQHYSDYAECSSAIKVIGAKVYRSATGYNEESAYEEFRKAYSDWLKNQKTGKTKNVKGVQQQDGLLPYALTDNTDELKNQSKKYFSDKANSPDGKNVLSKKEYTTNDAKSQEKIWKWKIDTDEFNEMLKTNFWVQLTNGLLAIVGMLMFAAVFVFSSVYAFDVVSNGYFNVTHKITFGKWDYVDDRKENVKVFGKLCVAMYFSCVIWNGTAFKWAVTIMNIAYQALTTK